MSGPDDEGFWDELRQDLVGFARRRGWSVPDAEDVAQTALTSLLEHGDTIRRPRAYAHKVVKNGLTALANRQHREVITDLDRPGSQAGEAALDVYHQGDADTRVRDLLVLLWHRQQQRKVAGLAYLEWTGKEIAGLLGVKASTAGSNLRHARAALKPYRDVDEHTLHHRHTGRVAWEAFHRGEVLPATPRPVIMDAWNRAKFLGVDPRHAPVTFAEPGELAWRRERCWLDTARSWVLAELSWLALRAAMMMVVTDPDGIVLWRGGDPQVMRKADKLGFDHGACWDMKAQGVNGISLALETGRRATVHQFEHFVESHCDLSCVAQPVRDPRDGRVSCCINLTGTQPIVHRAIALELDAIARRMKRRLLQREVWLPNTGRPARLLT